MAYRYQTPQEEFANTLTHGIGIVLSLVAIPFLLLKASQFSNISTIVCASIFSAGMLAVYTSSTIYHALRNETWKARMRIVDHVCIFLLIGGTYTPIVQQYTDADTAIIFLSIQWTIILLGILLKLFFTGKYNALFILFYVMIGCMAIFLIKPLAQSMPLHIFGWILAGGLAYLVGVFFYKMKNLLFAHSIWHCFVLLGTMAHFFAVYQCFQK